MSAMDALTVASLRTYTSATLHHLTVGIDFSNIHVLSHLHGFPALRKLALAVCTLTYWDQPNPDLSLKEPLYLPSVTAFALECGRTYRDPYARSNLRYLGCSRFNPDECSFILQIHLHPSDCKAILGITPLFEYHMSPLIDAESCALFRTPDIFRNVRMVTLDASNENVNMFDGLQRLPQKVIFKNSEPSTWRKTLLQRIIMSRQRYIGRNDPHPMTISFTRYSSGGIPVSSNIRDPPEVILEVRSWSSCDLYRAVLLVTS
jgi:hypothetical protein